MTARSGRAEEFSQQDTLVIHEEQGGVSALKSCGDKSVDSTTRPLGHGVF